MKVEIRYYSRGGNTKRLADAIGEAINVEVKSIEEPLAADTDILFLGSSVYAFGVDDKVKKFIDTINVKVGRVINFSTAAIVKSTYKDIEKILKEKNITLAKEEFYCRGSFGLIHKGHPDKNDLDNAKKFAKEIVNKYLKEKDEE